MVIMNESFQSTTLKDAVFLSRRIMQRLIDLDLLCVSVTFLDRSLLWGRPPPAS
jgi:hypothetical protein